LEIYDDGGESVAGRANPPCLMHIAVTCAAGAPSVQVSTHGEHPPRWPELRFEDASGQPIAISVNGLPPTASWLLKRPTDQ